jgi:hypothetical protein
MARENVRILKKLDKEKDEVNNPIVASIANIKLS